MGTEKRIIGSSFSRSQQPALRFLVESALRRLKTGKEADLPRDRETWVEHLSQALISDSDSSHRSVIASLIANGVRSDEIYEYYIPAAARYLGEGWVKDEISFVDVTVGAARLQAMFRDRPGLHNGSGGCTIPFGQSVLMVIPSFEDHSLGAFMAADQLRRHGLWVHMGIRLHNGEIADLANAHRFSAIGISVATLSTLEKVTEVVDYLRTNADSLPPIVIGGRAVTDTKMVLDRTGADFAVKTAREAVVRCRLATVGSALSAEDVH